MRRLPPLRALEAFVRICRLGSARAAAEELGLSPSALSRRIAGLEEFVGKKLFTRAHQTMALTDDGRAFFDAVAPKLDELALAVEGHSADLEVMRLRIGVPPLFGGQRLFPRLPELRRQHPRLHIDIETSTRPEGRLSEALDAAVVLSQTPDPALHAVQLDENYVHAIVSQGLLTELGSEPERAALARQTFLIHDDLPASFETWCFENGLPGLRPAAIDHFDSGQMILEAAAQGLGIAIMHDDHVHRASDKRLATLFPQTRVRSPYSYWFVCRTKDLDSRPVRLFHDWLVGAAL